MAESIGGRLKHAWDVFRGQESFTASRDYGPSTSRRPDRPYRTMANEKSIISSIYTRLSVDASSIDIRHVRVDENGQYLDTIPSGLNDCLQVEANIDQASAHFVRDVVSSMLSVGCIAVVAVDTTVNPVTTGGYDVRSLRVGRIVQWYPRHVRVDLYNEKTGLRQEVTLLKRNVAIIENPFYDVMNESNSTLQRLLRKLSLLDVVDEKQSMGKLDLILQLPYVVKSAARKEQARERRQALMDQMEGSTLGIGYVDATEKITQLNRPVESNLLTQIQYLQELLFSQLGLTQEILNGSADEETMLNYYGRTIEPLLTAVTQAMKRTFITKTARTQGQSIEFYRDPFKLVPVSEVAEIADKFTRNEIMSPNEVRGAVGMKPRPEASANELANRNMPQSGSDSPTGGAEGQGPEDSVLADLEAQIDSILANPGGDVQDDNSS